jgi:hypothetical protein
MILLNLAVSEMVLQYFHIEGLKGWNRCRLPDIGMTSFWLEICLVGVFG